LKTYGTISYDADQEKWAIEATPDVCLRLKRVFARISAGDFGALHLSDTMDVARDLVWFIERYPLEMAPRVEKRLRARASEHVAQEKLIEDTLAQRVERLPFALALPLRDYQEVAASLAVRTGSLLVADSMGLGKTATAIGTIARPEALPALVMTLTALPTQWAQQVDKFAPNLRCHVLDGMTPYDVAVGPKGRVCRKHVFAQMNHGLRCTRCWASRDDVYHGRATTMPDVIIGNWHKLQGWGHHLSKMGLRSFVLDEAQEVRHPETARYRAAAYVRASVQVCVALSGTPIHNHGDEFFNVLEIVRPGALGERDEFMREWGGGTNRVKDPKAFGSFLRDNGLMLRRTVEEVGRELPKLQNIVQPVEANPDELDKVGGTCAELAKIILGSGDAFKGQRFMASREFSMQLRQATGIAKAPAVAHFIRMLLDGSEGGSVLLYGWHRAVYDIWAKLLGDFHPAFFTGEESPKQKAESKRRFIEGETRLMIMSLRAGAGLDGLQNVCSRVVYGEFDFSPAVHMQGTARVYRDGQAHPVFAYYLESAEGSDPIVMDILGVKKQQLDGVLDPNADIVEALEVDTDHVKKLAAAYLRTRGEAVVTPEVTP
jgi:SNF2 family DNA or RNA helicase